MQAECYYHMGNYAEAINLYEQALNLYLNHQNASWQNRIETQTISIQRDNSAIARARINWGVSKRINGIANIPDSFQVRFGNRDVIRTIQRGGIVQDAENRLVNVPKSCVACRCVCIVDVPSKDR